MTIWREKKTGKWYVRVMHKRKYHTTHEGYDKKEDAMQERILLKKRLQAEGTRSNLSHQNFGTLFLEYLKYSKEFNREDWYNAKRYIFARQFEPWYEKQLDEITSTMIEDHMAKRKETVSARSANLDFEILRAFYLWCLKRGYTTHNPLLSLRKYPLKKRRKVIPSREEVERLIDANINQGKDGLLVLLLIYSLGRISELINLTWNDLDMAKKVMFLKTWKTGGDEEIREIPLAGRLSEYLYQIPQEDRHGHLLKSRKGKPYKDLRKSLWRCLKRAGLDEKYGFHVFRHYGASALMSKNIDPRTIQELLGHHDLRTTNIYLQSLQDSKRQAMDSLLCP